MIPVKVAGQRVAERWVVAAMTVILAHLGLGTTGCHRPISVPSLPPVPLGEAARIINDNVASIEGTLRASGSVDGHFVRPGGGRQSYHLDGILFYLAPRCVRFDLKKFGESQLLFGSNQHRFWFYNGQDGSTFCGRHGVEEDVPEELPARPDQLVDALGLSAVPLDEVGRSTAPRTRIAQRIVNDAQQVLFITHDAEGRVWIEKEYWIDRVPPRLIRRVIFRDVDGVVDMDSVLENYQKVGSDGPQVAHTMIAEWPKQKARMRFEIRQWTALAEIGPTSVQFATPAACGDSSSPR